MDQWPTGHSIILHLRYSTVGEGVDTSDGFVHVLDTMKDISNYVWLRPACAYSETAGELVASCSMSGSSKAWISDEAAHLQNRIIWKVEQLLGVNRAD